MRAIVIPTTGQPELRDINTIEDIQSIIGGELEILPLTRDSNAYIHENGMNLGFVPNPLIDHLITIFKIRKYYDSFIGGTMVIMGNRNQDDEFDGEIHDIPDHITKIVTDTAMGKIVAYHEHASSR